MAAGMLVRVLPQLAATGALTAFWLLALVKRVLASRKPTKALKGTKGAHLSLCDPPTHNVQRQAALGNAGPIDHVGSVVLVPDENFDLDKTIFKTQVSKFVRFLLRGKLGNRLFWDDSSVEKIRAAYEAIPAAPNMDSVVLKFMEEDCDFSMEHADGSFMDHLNFCHDYSAVHFQEHSPRVLFLHSILGVGTNCFPMGKDKIPKLKSMLTEFEFKHVEAFPSILRMVLVRDFIEELSANHDRLHKLESVSFHRVIDNEPVEMSAEDLWIHLNFHVIHLIDFLPAACWTSLENDVMLRAFVYLLTFMQRTQQLRAHVNMEHPSSESNLEGQPLTLGSFIQRLIPSKLTVKAQIKQVRQYSAAIGHSLDYKLTWAA